jgi:periplasmic protein TonB
MPRDLFGDVTRPSISVGNRKWYTVPVSLLSHSAIVFAIVVIPLLATDAVPKPWQPIEDFITIAPVSPPPAPRPPEPVKQNDIPPPDSTSIPTAAPTGFAPERPEAPPTIDDPGPGVVLGFGDPTVKAVVPPPVQDEPPKPVRIGGAIRQPQRVREVQPVYPPIAQSARIQGIVIIEATIGADGQIVNARILRSVPLLDQAALDAVRQWQYTPTLLNGVPVPVIMTVTVAFTLSR